MERVKVCLNCIQHVEQIPLSDYSALPSLTHVQNFFIFSADWADRLPALGLWYLLCGQSFTPEHQLIFLEDQDLGQALTHWPPGTSPVLTAVNRARLRLNTQTRWKPLCLRFALQDKTPERTTVSILGWSCTQFWNKQAHVYDLTLQPHHSDFLSLYSLIITVQMQQISAHTAGPGMDILAHLHPESWAPPEHASWHWRKRSHPPCCQS